VFHFSLPLLIFVNIVQKPFSELWYPHLIFSTLATLAFIFLLGWFLPFRGVFNRYRHHICCGPYWSNVAYIGFPLAQLAYPEKGLLYASMVNAVITPFFLTTGSFAFSRKKSFNKFQILKKAILNPVILATLAAISCSLIIHAVPFFTQPDVVTIAGKVYRILHPIAEVGLPMAILAIGASIDIKTLKDVGGMVVLLSFVKLFVTPALVFWVSGFFTTSASFQARAVTTLLLATPSAVTYFIMTKEFDADEHIPSAMMCVTVLFSVLTLPLWVWFLSLYH